MAYLFLESSGDSNISMAVKALKLLFFSAGLLSTALMVKEAFVPFLCEILFPNLVAFWNSFRCFLSSPLYICIVINSVVLLIAATSSSHRHDDDPPPPCWEAPPPPTEEAPTLCSEQTLYHASGIGDDCAPLATSDVNDDIVEIEASKFLSYYNHEREIEKREMMDSNSEPDSDSLSRVDHEREGDGDDTMDSTWQTIVEGRSKKLTKSESVPPRSRVDGPKELRKLETFNDRASIRRLGGLRRDPSLDVEEFNRQVEAFINKFNRDMRLQRQESDQRFLDMIKRGL